MVRSQVIQKIVNEIAPNDVPERERAIALHDYVREKIKYGFTKYFDAAPPEYTISRGYGACNTKSRLLVILFRAAGIEACQHIVVLPKQILAGEIAPSRYWMISPELCHSYVDVKVDGKWCAIDSFVVDTPLFKGAQARLAKTGKPIGYGVRKGSTNTWDGQSDAFAQFDPSIMVEDHGQVDDFEAYFDDKRYRNTFLGIRFNTIFQWMGETGVAPMNNHIEKLRQYA